MTTPTFSGRPLPPNDWEGDDFTPGSGGAFVTCQDTSAGRMLYYATGGRYDIDGRVIRANIRPEDSDGVSLQQVADSILRLTNPPRLLRSGLKTLPEMRAWLDVGLGLVVDGWYAAMPRAYREQAYARFGHAVWIAYRFKRANDYFYRVYDPLNRDLSGYGKDIPAGAIEPFMRSYSGLCGWITLEPVPAIPMPPVEGPPVKYISYAGEPDALPSIAVPKGAPILDLEGVQWDTISAATNLRKVGNGNGNSKQPSVLIFTARYYSDGQQRWTVQTVVLP